MLDKKFDKWMVREMRRKTEPDGEAIREKFLKSCSAIGINKSLILSYFKLVNSKEVKISYNIVIITQ